MIGMPAVPAVGGAPRHLGGWNAMRQVARGVMGIAWLMAASQGLAFDPISGAISKGVATAMDVRSKKEVQADLAIDAAVSRKLGEQKGSELNNVSLLVFARHGALVGFANSEEVKRKAGELAQGEKRLRSLSNDIVVGTTGGGMLANALLDKKIDLKLTATKGVSSVNMRWKVYGGDVFLMGVARSKAEADLAVRTIKALDGVKAIHSSLRVGKS